MMNAAFNTDGNTMTQRALSSKSCGISSRTSRISFITVPAFWMRSFSFCSSSLLFAEAAGTHIAPARAPASNMEPNLLVIFISTASLYLRSLVSEYRGPELCAASVRNQNHYPSNQRQGTENRRNGNGVMFFLRGLDGPHVQNLLLRSVCEALISQGQHTNHQQNNAEWLHTLLRHSLPSLTSHSRAGAQLAPPACTAASAVTSCAAGAQRAL